MCACRKFILVPLYQKKKKVIEDYCYTLQINIVFIDALTSFQILLNLTFEANHIILKGKVESRNMRYGFMNEKYIYIYQIVHIFVCLIHYI